MSESTSIEKVIGPFPRFVPPDKAVAIYDGLAKIVPPIETIQEKGKEPEVVNWALAGSLALKVLSFEIAKKRELEGDNVKAEELIVDWNGRIIEKEEISLPRMSFYPLVSWRDTKDVDIAIFRHNRASTLAFVSGMDDITLIVDRFAREKIKLLRLGDRLILHPAIIIKGLVDRVLHGGNKLSTSDKFKYQIYREPQETFGFIEELFPGLAEQAVREYVREVVLEKIKDWDGGYTLKYLLDYPSNSKIQQIILEELRGLIENNKEFLPEVEEEFLLKFLFQVNTIRSLLEDVREDVKGKLIEKVRTYLTSFFQQASQLGEEDYAKELLSLRNFMQWVYMLKDNPEYLGKFIDNVQPAIGEFTSINPSAGWIFLLEGAKDLMRKLVERKVNIGNLFVYIDPLEVDEKLIGLDRIGNMSREGYKKKFSVLLEEIKQLSENDQRGIIEEGIEFIERMGYINEFIITKFMQLFKKES